MASETRPQDVPENANADCPGTSSDAAGKAAACEGCPNQQACATAPRGPDPDLAPIAARMSRVKHKILVLSGKGGVGKSTFSTQLAFALASQGKEVGLLDIDICGPSVPKMLGLEGQEVHQSASGWSPVYVEDNLAVMSIGFMLPDPDEAVIWRGPRKNGLIKQFLRDVDWGDLDFLVVDAPPGTSDEHITIAQCLGATSAMDGAVIVTTPQEVAIIDVRKEINFCRKVGLPVLGVVENMSGLQQRVPELRFTYAPAAVGDAHAAPTNGVCPLDVTAHVMALLRTQFQDLHQLVVHSEVFQPSGGGAAKMCADMGVRLLGRVPLDPALSRASEAGKPVFATLQQKQQAVAGGSPTKAGQALTSQPAVCLPALRTIVEQLLAELDSAAPTTNGHSSSNGKPANGVPTAMDV